ncbi:NAD(P)/FAD-dependent oxidoreductase [Bosea sp. NBC_00550]|uniref:NAD(P)/FAD-dependent oxidoreductase n=1 Tax=Bosea sp. NBC_00550 TaxID=2969621 RepID=UPI00222F2FBD|nr:FAD-binding oxidoreductase [Bosea sp. NBC_00550]UZF90877.1 FAD-binding oxidoreductase [Bosea sp. NBC_00550]
MSGPEPRDTTVAIIGAGIIGVTTAIALRQAGFAVCLIEPGEPGGEQAASYGNAGWLSPASVVPMSMPGLWLKVPGMLSDPLGPLAIRWSALPRLLPWLLRFLYAGATIGRVEATARALRLLLEPGPTLQAELAAAAGVPELVRRDGALYAYPSRSDFEADALAWRLRRDNGVAWTELEDEALRRAVPALSPRYAFGVLVGATGHCLDPGTYVRMLADYAERLGVTRRQARVSGFDLRRGRLAAVLTDGGAISADKAVICAGIHSKLLARAAGDSVSLESERGYHVVLSEPEAVPTMPVQTSDSRIGTAPVAAGLRGAGQVELCSVDAPPDWRRASIVEAHLKRSYPELADPLPENRVRRWMGHRPSTPDGLPVIGFASASTDIVHAYGHGHVGMASAPMTARIVCDLLLCAPSACPLAPYSPQRFNGFWPRTAASLEKR